MKIVILVFGIIMIMLYMSTRENFCEIKFGKEGYRVITLDEKKAWQKQPV